MRDSKAKRRHILDAAAALFVDQGFDGTTLAMVSERSGAAIGSLVHFFKDKAGLGAAVYDHVAAELVAGCEAALNGQGRDAASAIRALLHACLAWSQKFPNHRRLLGLLEANMSMGSLSRVVSLQRRLEQVLAEWADPLMKAGLLAPIPAARLYAVLLAPVLSIIGRDEAGDGQNGDDWLEALSGFAVSAVAPSDLKPKANSPRGGKGRAPSALSPQDAAKQPPLFS